VLADFCPSAGLVVARRPRRRPATGLVS